VEVQVPIVSGAGKYVAGVEVEHLFAAWRQDAAALAGSASEVLLRLVGETPPDAALTLHIGSAVGSRRLEMLLVVSATSAVGATTFARELYQLLSAPLSPARFRFLSAASLEAFLARPTPTAVAEVELALLPLSIAGPIGFLAKHDDDRTAPYVWPVPRPDDLRELCAALVNAGPDAAYRVHVASAPVTTDEQLLDFAAMALGERATTPTGLAEALRVVGRPLDVQALLGGGAAESPRVRAAIRAMTGSIRILPVPEEQASSAHLAWQVLSPAAWRQDPLQRLGQHAAAALVRLPATDVGTMPGFEVAGARAVPRAEAAPATGLSIGLARTLAGDAMPVVLPDADLARHVHIFGQTGTGKSTLLEAMICDEAARGGGFAVLDPHGRLAERILALLPAKRARDVVLIDAGDREHPVPLNPLAAVDGADRELALVDIGAMFYDLFDPGQTGIVGPRFETWLQMGLRTLADADGDRASLLDVPRLFLDVDFLKSKFGRLHDEQAIQFWTKEMGQTSDYHKSEMLGWFTSKWTRLSADKQLRAILGSGRDAVDIRAVVDGGGIVILNLAKSTLGELNSKLLGYLYLQRFWTAGLRRTGDRPFTLFVDEAHTFRVGPIGMMLAEARKFGIRLVLAHTHLDQLSPEIRKGLVGNVGTTIAFRLGLEDGLELSRRMLPDFPAEALTRLPNFQAATLALINGQIEPPFTLEVVGPGAPDQQQAEAIRARTRRALLVADAAEVPGVNGTRFAPEPVELAAKDSGDAPIGVGTPSAQD